MTAVASRRPHVIVFIASLFMVAAGSACQDGSPDGDPAACAALVDHLVELQLDHETDPARAAEREKHREALTHAISDRVTAECMSSPAAHRECALRATSAADLTKCN